MENNLEYSDDGQLARVVFYSNFNDLNIYVEDTDSEYFYESIFNRLFEGEINIKAIFPMDGKEGVRKAYNSNGKVTCGINNLYLVDGDFDKIIHRNSIINDDHFVYLNNYDIESYMLDKEATILFMQGVLKKNRVEVIKIIEYDNWYNTIVSQMKKLFILFCAVQKANPSECNCGASPYYFINDKTGFERKNAYENYYKKIRSKINTIDNEIAAVKISYENEYGVDYYSLICGKYLIESLYCYLNAIKSIGINKNNFKWMLATNFDIKKLYFIKHIVEKWKS